MSRKRRATSATGRGSKRAAVASGSTPRSVPVAWLVSGLLLVIGLGSGWWLIGRSVSSESNAAPSSSGSIGGVADCRALPRFNERLGYKDRLGISTSERNYVGLVIFDGRIPLTAPVSERDLHQEPSWSEAGTLGPFVLDRQGHIYTAPVPRTAVSDNPPDVQNTIYRVDSDTAVMQPYLTLPDTPPASPQNPFGILGMAYDCDSDALYVSTVAGSTLSAEQGQIVRVDLETGTVTPQVVGVDAIGLAVFRGVQGKRLYFGLARESTLASVALDAEGHAVGDIRTELNLTDYAGGMGEPKVRRISFERETMTLYIVPFNFNLRAVSEQQQVIVRYHYDQQRDGWVFMP